jgi:hypothetical protein
VVDPSRDVAPEAGLLTANQQVLPADWIRSPDRSGLDWPALGGIVDADAEPRQRAAAHQASRRMISRGDRPAYRVTAADVRRLRR